MNAILNLRSVVSATMRLLVAAGLMASAYLAQAQTGPTVTQQSARQNLFSPELKAAAAVAGADPVSSSPLDAKKREIATAVLKGMQGSRERLVTGVCRIRGKQRETRKGQTTVETPIDCFCAFDFPRGLYRFDRNAPTKDGIVEGGRMIRTPAHVYSTRGIETEHLGGVMQERPGSADVGHIAPFDIRCVGLFNFVGPYWERTFGAYYHGFSTAELDGFSEEGKGVYRLKWMFGNRDTAATMWLDSSKGYSWIRYEVLALTVANEKLVTEVSWNEMNKAWVPVALRLTNDHWNGDRNEAEWTIDWESVNDAVPEDHFQPASFAPGRRVAIFSAELGQPVVVGYSDSSPPPEPPPLLRLLRQSWKLLMAVLLLLLFLTAVLGVLCMVRRQRRGQVVGCGLIRSPDSGRGRREE